MNKRAWLIQSSCALTGEGIYEGLEWVIKEVKKVEKNKRNAAKLKTVNDQLRMIVI